jgi:adenylate kinase family enzyme
VQFLNRQFENLIILTGAGSSVGIGQDIIEGGNTISKKGKLLSELWDDTATLLTAPILARFCKLVHYEDKKDGVYIKNLEKLLSFANAAKEFVSDTTESSLDVLDIIDKIEKLIREKCELMLPENSPHEILLERITKRKVTLPRAKIFTLNYDTLFEQAARRKRFTVIDGFSFSVPRIFSGNNFDYDIVQREKRGMKDEDNFIKKVFHIYKPHGSVDWERTINGNVIQKDFPVKPLMIFPKDSKYENSYDQPFFEMMSRFQQNLRSENVLLISVGFSFNDKHIVAMIKEALVQNPSFQLMIVNKGIDTSENFKWLFELAGIHSNIVLIDELFADFCTNFPELKSYNQEENNKIVIVSNDKQHE